MNRDYKKENENRKRKVKRFVVDIEKDLAEEFTVQLQKDGKQYSDWVRDNIKIYLKKN
jgi:metal-responsive CopG/Arc/MetJ family transcriptional regulator